MSLISLAITLRIQNTHFMKTLGVSAGDKPQSNPPAAGRIHFHTFTGWMLEGLPLREQPRVRFVGRSGRALVLGLKP